MKLPKKIITTNFLARTAIFAAMSIILYVVPLFNFNLPIFPSFLKIHLDEIPAMIAGFAYGPLSGLFIILIKTLAKLPMTSTLCVGELIDFICSCAFVLPAAFFYKKHRTLKGAGLSILIGLVSQVIIACFVTTFAMLDFYIFVMNFPEGAILSMCQAVNPNVTDIKWSYFFMIALPFNALKDAMVAVATFVLYKHLHRLIDRVGINVIVDSKEPAKVEESNNVEENQIDEAEKN